MLLMSLKKTNFPFKVIKFTNDFMYNDEIKMLREKNLTTKFSPNNRWEFCKSIPLCQFINIRDITLLWKIACKKVNTLSTKKEDCKFQVGCM